MKKLTLIILITILSACKSDQKPEADDPKSETETKTETETQVGITPIQHASFFMNWGDQVIYLDPVGGKDMYAEQPEATLVLITDIHGDHFDTETLESLPQTFDIVAPYAVFDKMPDAMKSKTEVLKNNKTLEINGLNIKAIPMYNTTEERKKFHEKGRGNGYVISKDDYHVYVSGDTEDIPEMRSLKNIDLAFLCMNLPYTMTPEAAASATLEFQPQKIMPYHYRGAKNGETFYYDVNEFKSIVNSKNKDIEVELLEWYPNK